MIINYESLIYNVVDPSQCPHCHNGIEPRPIHQSIAHAVNYSIWKCTFRDCGKLFIAVHQVLDQRQLKFIGFLDGQPIGPYWPQTIKKIKSKFIETYNQALKAEYFNLDEIAGMGFRKAIEYLVKDYLIHSASSLEGKIEDKLLANIISENFNSPQEKDLKDLLQRATWLGNDMVHYLKYHENFDINDLKDLIQLVMDEIHSIEQKRHYITNIQSKYKK
jgi:hypothetical protein